MDSIEKARQLHAQGKSVRQIATQLKVSKSTVGRWVQKSFLTPSWQVVGGPPDRSVDIWGGLKEPDYQALLDLYAETTYTCANWLSDEVASTPLKLYVETAPGQNQPKNGLFSPVLKATPDGSTVQEVYDHPARNILDHPNEWMSDHDFLKVIDTHLSMTGNCFVHIHREEMYYETRQSVVHHLGEGLPVSLIPLKPPLCKLAYDKGEIVGIWYQPQMQSIFIPVEDMIWFKLINPSDPFGLGLGPTRAIYERLILQKSELGYIGALYRNSARPDALLSLKDSTADQRERAQKEINMRFAQGGQGGILALDTETMDLKPLQLAPKDVLGEALYKWNRLNIINAFKLNPAVLDQESSNRAVAETARRQAQAYAVVPRLSLIEEKLNMELMPEFDRRLKVAFEIVLAEDADYMLSERTSYLDRGVKVINEIREELGLPPVAWGNVPYIAGRASEITPEGIEAPAQANNSQQVPT